MTYWIHNVKVVGVTSFFKLEAVLRDSDTKLRLAWNILQYKIIIRACQLIQVNYRATTKVCPRNYTSAKTKYSE